MIITFVSNDLYISMIYRSLGEVKKGEIPLLHTALLPNFGAKVLVCVFLLVLEKPTAERLRLLEAREPEAPKLSPLVEEATREMVSLGGYEGPLDIVTE